MRKKCIALVAHDHQKDELVAWAAHNADMLQPHHLLCTGTTGRLIQEMLEQRLATPPEITRLKSGPLGGDQQLGALITEGKVDMFVFFWDPMHPQPHDVDVKALLRIVVLYNIPTASNRATADYLISSPLFSSGYTPTPPNFTSYLNREIPTEPG